MDKPSHIFLGIGFACLLLGLLLPWVSLASPTEKDLHLQEFGDLLNQSESLPAVLQTVLQDHGWQNPQQLHEIKQFFQRDMGLGETFTRIYKKNWLFSWDFFRLSAAEMTRFLIVVLVVLCVAIGAVLAYLVQGGNNYDAALTIITAVSFFLLLSFIFQIPLLDSLGHQGNRAYSLLDVIIDARVTFVPRLLIPIGLLSSVIAGFESLLTMSAGGLPDGELD